MSRYFQRVFFLILIASLNSCSYLATYQLIGVWRVVEIFEDNKLLRDRTIENIILQFNEEDNIHSKEL